MSFFIPRQPGVFLVAIVAVLGADFSGGQLEIIALRHTIQVPLSHVSLDTVKNGCEHGNKSPSHATISLLCLLSAMILFLCDRDVGVVPQVLRQAVVL